MSRYVDLDGVSWDGKPISSKIQEVQTKHGCMQGITIGWLWGDNVPYIDLEEHDKHIIEQYKENVKLKDTIKNIHDSVSIQMYCKGIDEYKNALLKLIKDEQDTRYGYLSEMDIREVAEQLKKGVKYEV